MELKEATSVEALRYLPRNSGGDGGYNGIVTDYEIQYRENESDEWKTISTGHWKGYKDEALRWAGVLLSSTTLSRLSTSALSQRHPSRQR